MQPVHTKMLSLMRAIVREEGYRGLMRGLTARVAKIAPSCAIMISSYEIGKKALSEQWWGLGGASSSSGQDVTTTTASSSKGTSAGTGAGTAAGGNSNSSSSSGSSGSGSGSAED